MWHFTEVLEERFIIPHQDFTELRQTVERLARAQERTEQRVEHLARAQGELATAQVQTEQRLEQLAAAQERTEQAVKSLADAVSELRKIISDQFSKIGSR